jgi:hypothetical protein
MEMIKGLIFISHSLLSFIALMKLSAMWLGGQHTGYSFLVILAVWLLVIFIVDRSIETWLEASSGGEGEEKSS